MNKTIIFLAIMMALGIGGKAQINLVGAANNLQTGKIDIVKWQALNAESVIEYPSILDGYYFATSSFDSYNSNYYLTGISGQYSGLYSFNTLTNEENLAAASTYTNISEFDMSTGKLYNLKMETEEYISIYEYEISTGNDSLIGVIYEPGANGLVVDAIGFDANNGILYYVGFTNDPALCLYSIPVRDNQFSFSRTILNTTEPFNNITSVNFDNVNETIYARNATYDSSFNYTGSYVVELDKSTGDIITRGQLAEFPYFVGGSSTFDQNTGTFLLVGIDTSNVLKMIAFNTYNNTYVTGFVPGNVSEIVCDNTLFVQNNYITTGISEVNSFSFKVFPNPVRGKMQVSQIFNDKVSVRVYTMQGTLVVEKSFLPGNNIELDLSMLLSGTYLMNILAPETSSTQKIIVQ